MTGMNRSTRRGLTIGVAILATASASHLAAQSAPEPIRVEWDLEIPAVGVGVGNAVVETSDGGFIVTGYGGTDTAGMDGLLARIDASGQILWRRTYGGPGDDFLWDVQEASDGGFMLVGFRGPERGIDVWILRTDARGEVLWERTYGGVGRDRAWAVTGDGQGGWYVAAETTPEGTSAQDAWILRLDADGDTAWTRTLGGADAQRVFSVALLPRGDVAVAGGTGSDDRRSGDNDMLIAQFRPDGRLRWSHSFGGDAYDVAHGVVSAGDGLLVTGYGTPPGAPTGETDVILLRLGSDGEESWRSVVPVPGHERAMMSAPIRGGWVTIGFGVAGDGVDLRLSGHDLQGRERWRWMPPGPGTDRGVMVRPTSDGGFVVTGAFGGTGPGGSTFRVLKVRPTGAE
jgi:hypothetical protein